MKGSINATVQLKSFYCLKPDIGLKCTWRCFKLADEETRLIGLFWSRNEQKLCLIKKRVIVGLNMILNDQIRSPKGFFF